SASYNPLHMLIRSGLVHLRAEAWTLKDEDGQTIADKAHVFITMSHSAEASLGSTGTAADVRAFFDSLQVRHIDNRAVLQAALPTEVIRKLADSPSQIPALTAPAPEQPVPPKKNPKASRKK